MAAITLLRVMLLGYKSSLYICSLRRFNWKFRWGNHLNTQNRSTTMSKKVVKWTSWWFQPIWKILVNLDHSARQGKNNETTTWRHFFQSKFAETVLSLRFNMCRSILLKHGGKMLHKQSYDKLHRRIEKDLLQLIPGEPKSVSYIFYFLVVFMVSSH